MLMLPWGLTGFEPQPNGLLFSSGQVLAFYKAKKNSPLVVVEFLVVLHAKTVLT